MSSKEALEFTPGNLKEAMAGVKSGDLWNVPYEMLYIMPGYNVREHDEEFIETLTGLIMENGFDRKEALGGYIALIDGEHRVVVTKGHRRHAAVGRARERGMEIETLPVITSPRGTTTEDLTVELVTSNSGQPLKPYEVGTVIKRLIGFGWDHDKIAKKLAITKGYVDDLMLLHEQSRQLRDLVRTGKIAAGFAIATIKKHGPKALEVLQAALGNAEAKGKAKASRKDLAPHWKSAFKERSLDLYDTVMWVKEDPNFARLSEGTRQVIETLLAELPEGPSEEEIEKIQAAKQRKINAAEKKAEAAKERKPATKKPSAKKAS